MAGLFVGLQVFEETWTCLVRVMYIPKHCILELMVTEVEGEEAGEL